MQTQECSKTETGARFERMAEAHLLGLGYRLLARNFRIKGGEIDLVFEDWRGERGVLVLVEVRMRDANSFLRPEESITGLKEARLKKAAVAYISRYQGRAKEVRFDLVAVRGTAVAHYPDFIRD